MTSQEKIEERYKSMTNQVIAELKNKGVPIDTLIACVDWYMDPATNLPMHAGPVEQFLMLGVLNRLLHFNLVKIVDETPKIVLVQ